MTTGQARAVRPVKDFFGRLAVQVVISGSAMAAIHFGIGLVPELAPWLGLERPVVASLEAPPSPRPIVFAAPVPVTSVPPPFAIGFPPALQTASKFPIPEAAPARPVRMSSLEKPRTSFKSVQIFDACQPACPSRDPLVHPAMPVLAAAVPVAMPVSDRGTDYPEVLDDGLEEDSYSLLAAPGRAVGAVGRTARDAWSKLGALSPFD